MKIIQKISLGCILLFTACGNPSQTKTGSKTEEKSSGSAIVILPDNFYKKLKGKMGDDIFITIDLIRRKDSTNKKNGLGGYYYYDKIGMPLSLYGDINDSGKFELREVDKNGENTGVFHGTFISENEIKGTWTNPKTKKQYPFSLTAEVANNTQFDFFEFYKENCKYRDKNMKSAKKDTLSWTDTLCSSVSVSLINLAHLENKACSKMNSYIMNTVMSLSGEKPYSSIKELTGTVDALEDGEILDAEYATRIVSNENNVLCMSVSYWANTGGAHPNGVYFFLNFDTRTGDTISLLDILLPETIDELVVRAKKQFIKENGDIKKTGWFWDEGEFKMPQTFSVNKGGLLFVYQNYEAGPYSMGMPQFFIPFKELKDIVKPEYLK